MIYMTIIGYKNLRSGYKRRSGAAGGRASFSSGSPAHFTPLLPGKGPPGPAVSPSPVPPPPSIPGFFRGAGSFRGSFPPTDGASRRSSPPPHPDLPDPLLTLTAERGLRRLPHPLAETAALPTGGERLGGGVGGGGGGGEGLRDPGGAVGSGTGVGRVVVVVVMGGGGGRAGGGGGGSRRGCRPRRRRGSRR